jgi:hypothetical protein
MLCIFDKGFYNNRNLIETILIFKKFRNHDQEALETTKISQIKIITA